jgi:hypothetical protein
MHTTVQRCEDPWLGRVKVFDLLAVFAGSGCAVPTDSCGQSV